MISMNDIREMDQEQMEATLKECYQQLFRLKVKAQTDRLDQPSELSRNRKLVARIKTVQSQRRLEEAAKAEAAAKPAEPAAATTPETTETAEA
jgi:large subunit ribosomal protein L29